MEIITGDTIFNELQLAMFLKVFLFLKDQRK
jgi:hypothetical protein